MVKVSHTSKLVEDEVKSRKAAIKAEKANARKQSIKETTEVNEYRMLMEASGRKQEVRVQYNKFTKDTKTLLVSECICKLLNESTSVLTDNIEGNTIKTNLVNNFVESYGVEKLLNRFKTKNLLLAEFYLAVDKAYNAILESVDKENPDTFQIDTTIKDTFFDDLDMTNADEAIISIRNRVIDAETDFVNDNIRDKVDIDAALNDAKNRIDATSDDTIKESANIRAKSLISDIKYRQSKNIYNTMVKEVTESVAKSDNLKQVYMENGLFNMDKITENVNIIYSFLECLNTAQIVDVNENFIQDFVNDLKA